ncbi:MAG: hypothetical protein ABFR82_09160 [Nitrospirota bacterium]
MVFEEDRDIVRYQAEQVLEGQFPNSIEHRIVQKDGAMLDVRSDTDSGTEIKCSFNDKAKEKV